jgi:uncharacterized protein YndB with AHSA1/START domain
MHDEGPMAHVRHSLEEVLALVTGVHKEPNDGVVHTGGVEPKDLDWIEQAPFSISGSATTTASPEAVFAVLADHERWPEWFPIITKTVVVGPAREGVGMLRQTSLPGGHLDEIFIAWDPGKQLAFTCTAIKPGISHALVDNCLIERVGDRTHVTYATYLDPVATVLPIMKLTKGLLDEQLDKGMRALVARAEGR